MARNDYIPPNVDKFDNWQDVFMTVVSDDSNHFGVSDEQMALLATKQDAHNTANALRKSTEAAAAVAKQKAGTARSEYEKVLREAAQVIQKNPDSTNAIRKLLGLTLLSDGQSPLPPIETVPFLRVANLSALRQKLFIRDSMRKSGKAPGAKSLQLFCCIRAASDPVPTTMEEFTFVESVTTLTYTMKFASSQSNMIAYYIGFWKGSGDDHSGVSEIKKLAIQAL